LTLPLAGCVEDFHLPVTSVATTAKLVALARNAPCLAHQKKARIVRYGLFFTRRKINYLILPSL
ncbi:hypothetical protein, partial [Pseudomonas sp. PA-3-10C]